MDTIAREGVQNTHKWSGRTETVTEVASSIAPAQWCVSDISDDSIVIAWRWLLIVEWVDVKWSQWCHNFYLIWTDTCVWRLSFLCHFIQNLTGSSMTLMFSFCFITEDTKFCVLLPRFKIVQLPIWKLRRIFIRASCGLVAWPFYTFTLLWT